MERMKDLTQQYVEQLNKMIKDLREEKFRLEEENKKLKLENAKLKDRIITDENFEEKLDKENKKLKAELKKKEEDVDYRHHRCMVAERQVQHSLGGDDELIYEEGLYD